MFPSILKGTHCKSQDFAGKTNIILRAVPLVAALMFRPLPSQIVIPISPAKSWDLQGNITPKLAKVCKNAHTLRSFVPETPNLIKTIPLKH
jgi:hypothetical protein